MVGQSGQKAPKVPHMKSFTLENIRVSKVSCIKDTRIKSFMYKMIRVSKVACIKWYAYQNLCERFHTCMFKDQSKLPIPYMYVFIGVTFNTHRFITCKINNVLLLQRVRFLTCTICNAYLLIHESIYKHWRRIYTYEKRYTYQNFHVQMNSR